MAKNVLIFSDGTGQVGGLRPDQRLSNVYKLFRATRPGPDSSISPSEQVAFYDPGLGTVSDAGGIRLNVLDKLLAIFGLATGMGITDNIIDCYEAILKHYRPGDRICLFGFSRGAYTVRSVANVLRLCGVPTRDESGALLPTDGPNLRRIARRAVVDVYEYRFTTLDEQKRLSAREEAAINFRRKYGSEGSDPDASNVAPEFVGVFDSVAALGARGGRLALLVCLVALLVAAASVFSARVLQLLVTLPFETTALFLFTTGSFGLGLKLIRERWKAKGYDKSLDPRTGYARHALAIDETRVDFRQVPWGHSQDAKEQHRPLGEWFKQIWFAGNHSDIGGSYPEDESRLSDISLGWMIGELQTLVPTIQIDRSKLSIFGSSAGMQHCEVQYSREKKFGLFPWASMPRSIDPSAPLHSSVLDRFAMPTVPHCRTNQPYRPESLRQHIKVAKFYAAPSMAERDPGETTNAPGGFSGA